MFWFEDPMILINEPQKFWPKTTDTLEQQVNAVSRFIIYGSILSFFLRKDKRIIIACILLLISLFVFSKFRKVSKYPDFNKDDPMGNFNEFKIYDEEKVKKSMNSLFPENTANAERAFFTMPSNDLKAYLDFVHGGKNKPFCRQDQSACSADDNPRMMEIPQRRAVTNIPVFL